MISRTAIFSLFIYLLFTWGCAKGISADIINKQGLSKVELEKVEVVKVFMDAKDLEGRPYKVITQVKGFSTDTCHPFSATRPVDDTVNRDDAVEQVKIRAMRAGGNAITNLVCVFDNMRWGYCGKVIECTADAIQVN